MLTRLIWIICLFLSFPSFVESIPKKRKKSVSHAKKQKHPKNANSNIFYQKSHALPSHQQVVLTFDDGPDLTKTPRVLDLLDRYQYKAIFFVIGARFENNSRAKELLKEIVKRGHIIGNHTIHHDERLCSRDDDKIREEIEKNAKMIEDVIGVPPLFFRAPYGALCKRVKNILTEFHMTHTSWDIDPQDWKKPRDPEKNLAAIKQELSQLRQQTKPLILLLHDIHEETIQTLPPLFAWFQTQPYLHVVHPFQLIPEPTLFKMAKESIHLIKNFMSVLENRLQGFLVL